MASDVSRPDKDEIAREILAYLADHPGAQDTLEGIAQWWLLERKVKYQTEMVEETLARLVKSGLVLERMAQEAETKRRYCINSRKKKAVRKLLLGTDGPRTVKAMTRSPR